MLNECRSGTLGGKAHHLVSETGQVRVSKELAWEDVVFHNLEEFAVAIASIAEYPFTSGQMVRNFDVLESITRSGEDRCSVEITEIA